jgi:hypothetical protein
LPAKANGPLLEDYTRALKAAKKAGAKAVRVEIGGSAITILLDDALAAAQPVALLKSERCDVLTEAERRALDLKL